VLIPCGRIGPDSGEYRTQRGGCYSAFGECCLVELFDGQEEADGRRHETDHDGEQHPEGPPGSDFASAHGHDDGEDEADAEVHGAYRNDAEHRAMHSGVAERGRSEREIRLRHRRAQRQQTCVNDSAPNERTMSEQILEPGLPIIDPHHHLWDRPTAILRNLLPSDHGFMDIKFGSSINDAIQCGNSGFTTF